MKPNTGAALAQLRQQGYPVPEADAARLSPLGDAHLNTSSSVRLASHAAIVPALGEPTIWPMDEVDPNGCRAQALLVAIRGRRRRSGRYRPSLVRVSDGDPITCRKHGLGRLRARDEARHRLDADPVGDLIELLHQHRPPVVPGRLIPIVGNRVAVTWVPLGRERVAPRKGAPRLSRDRQTNAGS